MVGGNFLETLPDELRSRMALRRPRLRIHQDIVVSSAMLEAGDGDVLLLPAATRYESPGGGTETSTERRIIFSPEIPGRRIGSAQPEWWVFRELMARLDPSRRHLVGLDDAAAIRSEIARTTPLYKGVEHLARKGDQVQWGGRTLYADGRYATPDGKAHFAPVSMGATGRPADAFAVSTRRGKQFNSMVHEERDPLTGAARHDVLVAAADAAARGLADGDPIVVRSPHGVFTGRLRVAALRPGNVQGFWPEVNGLLSLDRRDAESGVPDDGTPVTIERGSTP